MSEKPLIVAPYTAGTPYAQEAEELREGAVQFGLCVEPIEVPDHGDWRHNICLKPRAIFERMVQHDGPVLVLDADCRVLQPLDELMRLGSTADVMIKHRPGYAFTALFNVGVIYFAATRAARLLAQTWAERTERHGIFHRFPDQATFTEAMLDAKRFIRFRNLPLKFHVEPRDADKVPEAERVIFHHKSSRAQRNARKADGPQPLPIDTGLPAEFICLRPERAAGTQGLALNGNDGASADYAEYARRFGIDRVWTLRLPIAVDDWAALDHCRIFSWRSLAGRFPPNTPILVTDLNVLMMQSPRPWCQLLEHADVVVAWDRRQSWAVPSIRCVAMRTSGIVVDQFLPQLERRYLQRRESAMPDVALAEAMAEVLNDVGSQVRVATLPGETIVPMNEATSQSQMITTNSDLKLTGEPSWHRPRFLRRPQQSQPQHTTFPS